MVYIILNHHTYLYPSYIAETPRRLRGMGIKILPENGNYHSDTMDIYLEYHFLNRIPKRRNSELSESREYCADDVPRGVRSHVGEFAMVTDIPYKHMLSDSVFGGSRSVHPSCEDSEVFPGTSDFHASSASSVPEPTKCLIASSSNGVCSYPPVYDVVPVAARFPATDVTATNSPSWERAPRPLPLTGTSRQ
jgi:hypothetical protein